MDRKHTSRTGTRGLRAALAAALALLVFAAVALAVPPETGRYVGNTSQKKPVSIRVNDNGRIKRFNIDWQAPCEKPGSKWVAGTRDVDGPGDRIAQDDGVFSDFGKYTQKSGPYKGHFRVTIKGEFTTATHAEGTFKAKVRVTRDGDTVDHCEKLIRWKVNPQ